MPAISGFIISLTPNTLSVIHARKGRVQQAESIGLDHEEWSGLWSDGLMRLDQPLRQLLSRFGGKTRQNTTVLYQSPTLTKQIYHFEQGGAFARDAARSKLRESIGLKDPVSVCTLGRDLSPNHPCMMLAYSEREETLRSVYAWLNRCGVQASGMIPMSVASIVLAANEATRFDDSTAVLFLDAESSIVAHTRGDDLTLVRPADLGYRKLIESYHQVFSERFDQSGDDQSKDDPGFVAPNAHQCLFDHGVPFQPVDCAGVELRSAVLPCMAPVLQRIGIDVKQTIRFGIESAEGLRNLQICGPGAAIPGITKAIGEHLELHVQASPGSENYQPLSAGGQGTIEAQLIETPLPTQGLLPGIAGDERNRRMLNKALVAGCALAVVGMGFEYGLATLSIGDTEQQIASTSHKIDRVREFEERRDRASEVAVLISSISKLIADNSTESPLWVPTLAKLSSLAGDQIRIQEIRGDRSEGQPFLVVSGYSIAEETRSPGESLDGFVGGLNAHPQIRSVSLGATSRVELPAEPGEQGDAEHWGLQFTLRLYVEVNDSNYGELAQWGSQTTGWVEP